MAQALLLTAVLPTSSPVVEHRGLRENSDGSRCWAGDAFSIVSLSGNTAMIGSFWDDEKGSAYVFTGAGQLDFQQKLPRRRSGRGPRWHGGRGLCDMAVVARNTTTLATRSTPDRLTSSSV